LARASGPVDTAERLAAIVERAAPATPRGRRRIHPATRVFQALRIAVNDELDALRVALAGAVELLRPGGRLVVLSYHSLEDRIVKRFLAAERRGCTCPAEAPMCVCGKQPASASSPGPRSCRARTNRRNPRARSARLRAAERIAA
jgi:16S rRNA (cytosine1402-N4)-methyltransferase